MLGSDQVFVDKEEHQSEGDRDGGEKQPAEETDKQGADDNEDDEIPDEPMVEELPRR